MIVDDFCISSLNAPTKSLRRYPLYIYLPTFLTMADTLCGPSNALQNFQKHTQVDRTLQQDRLRLRQGPSQGFRSSPGPNVGILDPEFEAFQAGHVASPTAEFDSRPFVHQNMSHFAPAPAQTALPDWATDFQRLHIGPAHATSSHQSPAPAVQRAPAATQTSWHQDFMQSQQPVINGFRQPQPIFRPYSDVSWEYRQQEPFSTVSEGKQKAVGQQDMQWDAEAFAAAFEAATQDAAYAEAQYDDGLSEEALAREIAREIEMESEEIEFLIQRKTEEEMAQRMERQETNHLTGLDLSQDFVDVDEEFAQAENLSADAHLDENLHDDIGIHEPIHEGPREAQADTQESNTPRSVDEELARTAGRLLESVSHDTSEKFQSSVFLQLMRRLRDREVTVEGENFVETGTTGPSPPADLGDSVPSAQHQHSTPVRIPEDEQDSDLWRFGDDAVEGSVAEPDAVPERPLTPEFDPPAPPFEAWRKRLWSGMT
ncbi:hypothetical protein, variant 1 [Verruconis gallopava]|uniref:Uncharacterized protein n=1 Tax=Verruconis gallopava TaxID=253628 RepID=A0A0D2B6M0_9PEZI|nr:hypothetical protein, variant 1 [Verruconis gallopava]KIW06889.1 hypothetical protein, variant 1 [Verruconis gallopava]